MSYEFVGIPSPRLFYIEEVLRSNYGSVDLPFIKKVVDGLDVNWGDVSDEDLATAVLESAEDAYASLGEDQIKGDELCINVRDIILSAIEKDGRFLMGLNVNGVSDNSDDIEVTLESTGEKVDIIVIQHED